MSALIVLAKAPAPGRSKTRLCPPLTPEQAASLAGAMLADTLAAVAATRVDRRVLVLDGTPDRWLRPGFEVLAQRGDGLDERIAAAFEDVGGPALLVGMDTPQITPKLLERSLAEFRRPGVDAVLGRADDGGYWGIGLRRADAQAFLGVPMSMSLTAVEQLARLRARGLAIRELPILSDVDVIEDAWRVAARAPRTRSAATLHRLAPLPVEVSA